MRISDWSSDVCSSDLPSARSAYAFSVPSKTTATEEGDRLSGVTAHPETLTLPARVRLMVLAASLPPWPLMASTAHSPKDLTALTLARSISANPDWAELSPLPADADASCPTSAQPTSDLQSL